MSAYYPNFKLGDKETWVQAWYLVFKDYDATAVNKALGLYVTKNTSGFAPTPGQLIEYMPKEEVSEQEVWSLIRNAISNGNYHAQEEFDNLPKELQKAVGSPQTIKEWALTDTQTLESVIQSQFLRTFRDIRKNIENSGGKLSIESKGGAKCLEQHF